MVSDLKSNTKERKWKKYIGIFETTDRDLYSIFWYIGIIITCDTGRHQNTIILNIHQVQLIVKEDSKRQTHLYNITLVNLYQNKFSIHYKNIYIIIRNNVIR